MKNKKLTVYIASPYTIGDVAENVRHSLFVADQLIANGMIPFTPLLYHFWHMLSPKDHGTWLELDLQWILRCDCLLRLEGESKGADIEVEFAKQNNIPVFFNFQNVWEYREREDEIVKNLYIR